VLGLVLLLGPTGPALAAEEPADRFYIVPDLALYPKLPPVDSGYPGNVPKDLPTALPAPPAVLSAGPAASCATTVKDVLTANKRTSFITLLSASAEGRAVLDGKMAATVLAPTDTAIASLKLLGRNAAPLSLSTVAHYHVMQGKLPLDDLLAEPGLWINTTLTKADCPTAYQTLVVVPGNGTTVRCGAAHGAAARCGSGGVGSAFAACGGARPRMGLHGALRGVRLAGQREREQQFGQQQAGGGTPRQPLPVPLSHAHPRQRPRARVPRALYRQAHSRGLRPRCREHGTHHDRRPAGLQQHRAPDRRRAAALLHLCVRAAAAVQHREDPAVLL
jgi:hypothetical protein